MAIKILMPSLSPTMTKGKIAKWNIVEGSKIEIGDVIAEVETDKAIMEFESVDAGIAGPILVPEGSDVEVGTLIGWILEDENDSIQDHAQISTKLSETDMTVREVPKVAAEQVVAKEPAKVAQEAQVVKTKSSDVLAKNSISTPAARARAAELQIDISKLTGTGPMGRIKEADVIAYSKSSQVANKTKASNMQRVIADRMTHSKTTVPHFYLETSACIDELQKFKVIMQESGNLKTTLTHWFVKLAGRAMQEVPELNTSWDNYEIIQNQSVDIALAVSMEKGLITPIIANVPGLSMGELVAKADNLISRAKESKLSPNEYQGGSLTISNLGMYGIDSFYPIINTPQSCILGIGAAKEELFYSNGQVEVRKMVRFTLSCDHRVVNGADAARFMQYFKQLVENPILLLS